LACGVTLPLNKASKASGMEGSGVWEGTGEATCVDVDGRLVALLSGIAEGASAWVASASGDASGIWAFGKGTDGRLNCGSRERTANRIPPATNAPRTEKAVCARTLFCWRMR